MKNDKNYVKRNKTCSSLFNSKARMMPIANQHWILIPSPQDVLGKFVPWSWSGIAWEQCRGTGVPVLPPEGCSQGCFQVGNTVPGRYPCRD